MEHQAAHDALARHMRAALKTYGHDRLELEWRLGHRQGHFRPGVDTTSWARLQLALDASPAFTKSFSETTEKMGDVAGVKCICSGRGEQWMHKKRLANVDVDPAGPWGVRASVSLETLEHEAPGGVDLKYERRKQRWSYTHRCWRVDLTRVSSNLPSQLDEDNETHEVEIELVDTGVLFERTVDYVVEWGWSIAKDVCSMCVLK